jgi:hypothetical protein
MCHSPEATRWDELMPYAYRFARTLESLAAAGADLHVVMGYRYPRGEVAGHPDVRAGSTSIGELVCCAAGCF